MLVLSVRVMLPPAGMVALSRRQSALPVPPPIGVHTNGGEKLPRLARSKPACSRISNGPLKSPWPTLVTVMVKGHCTVSPGPGAQVPACFAITRLGARPGPGGGGSGGGGIGGGLGPTAPPLQVGATPEMSTVVPACCVPAPPTLSVAVFESWHGADD